MTALLESARDRFGGRGGGGGYRGGGYRGGGRPVPGRRVAGSWWRHWSWKKALALLVSLGCGVVLVGAVSSYFYYRHVAIPDPQAAALDQASTVYFNDGKTVVGRFGSTNRQLLTYNQIPPVMRNAIVAIEDRNFWHEGGISPRGILRAVYEDLTSSGGSLQGGSTLTQEFVRQYYDNIGTQQTVTRKFKEIFVAQKLAQEKSKEWILTKYLNTVYFGAGAYGVGAAAETYFGKPVSQLTAAQAAMLAALPQAPSGFSPNPKSGLAYQGLVYRWKAVLAAMVKMGTLSQQAESKALQQGFPKVIKPVNNSWSGYRGYVMAEVQRELQTVYHMSDSRINNGGLKIVTTVNPHLMSALYTSVDVNRHLMATDNPPGGTVVACRHTCLPSYVHVGAVLENPSNGAIEAWYGGPGYGQSQYDNALQSRNQVGSSFKPYVLATAVKQGMNVRKSTLDGNAPLWIPPDSQPMTFANTKKPTSPGSWYKVTNDETVNSQGPVSVVKATAESLNTAYTDLWHRVAYDSQNDSHPVTDMAKAFGVNVGSYPGGAGMTGKSPMQDQAGIALGQASLTVEEQATMMATLADNGTYHAPHVIARISQGHATQFWHPVIRQVLTPQQAADVNYAMSFDTSSFGTAAGLGLTNGQKIIAKTGTTNLSQEAFFLGATPMDAMAVGMFVNKTGCTLPVSEQGLCKSTNALSFTPPPGLQTLYGVGGLAGYGGQWPAQIWHTFFMNQFNTLPVQDWAPVNNWGTPWNLFGKLPPKKPKPKPHHSHFPTPGVRPTCNGNGNGQGGNCQPTPVPPSPTPAPTPTSQCGGFMNPCPSPTNSKPGGG